MSNDQGLLGLLAKKQRAATATDDAWATLAAKPPAHDPPTNANPAEQEAKLSELLSRINQLTASGDPRKTNPPSSGNTVVAETGSGSSSTAAVTAANDGACVDDFVPIEPPSIRDAGLTDSEVEALVLKYLLSRGDCTGREVADQVRLPFVLVDPLLRQLKYDQLLVYRGSAPMSDYVYQLTDLGR